MTIDKKKDGDSLTLCIGGRLDTMTAPELEEEIKAVKDVSLLVFDLTSLEYVSSAGLRVILQAQKTMNACNGKLILKHVNELVMSVFEVTGFQDILNIQ